MEEFMIRARQIAAELHGANSHESLKQELWEAFKRYIVAPDVQTPLRIVFEWREFEFEGSPVVASRTYCFAAGFQVPRLKTLRFVAESGGMVPVVELVQLAAEPGQPGITVAQIKERFPWIKTETVLPPSSFGPAAAVEETPTIREELPKAKNRSRSKKGGKKKASDHPARKRRAARKGRTK